MKRLEGKKIVVTGGTRGIGRAIAAKYVQHGAHVIIVGTNDGRGKEACEYLKQFGVSVDIGNCAIKSKTAHNESTETCTILDQTDQMIEFRNVNVADHKAVALFGKEVNEMWGQVDVVVNCAGITRDNLMIKIKEEDWDSVLDTNLKSVYNTTHVFLRGMMKNRGGRIINIASVIGLIGNPGQVNYAASKAGMVGLTKSLAKEVGSRNITINCIAPGFIETDMTDKLNDLQKEAILTKVPMGRLGTPEEIANAALFLASDEAEYITGQVLTVDGGMTA